MDTVANTYIAPNNDSLMIVNESALAPVMVWDWNVVGSTAYAPFKLHGAAALPTSRVIILTNDWDPWSAGQCVNWVNYQTGWYLRGSAYQWEKYINSHVYHDNSVIVLKMDKSWHVGITLKNENGTITYRSRNQHGLWVISDDTIQEDSPLIAGYIKPNE